MKYYLILTVACVLLSLAAAAPGMRGNGASGAVWNRDPDNPNLPPQGSSHLGQRRPRGSSSPGQRQAGASALATGSEPHAATLVRDQHGSKLSVASASTFGGNAVASAHV